MEPSNRPSCSRANLSAEIASQILTQLLDTENDISDGELSDEIDENDADPDRDLDVDEGEPETETETTSQTEAEVSELQIEKFEEGRGKR